MGVSFALLQHSNVGELNELLRAMTAGIPLFLAALAISHCFIMNMESTISAEIYAIAIILILPMIMNMLGKQVELIAKLAYWFPYNLATPFFDENSMMQLVWNIPGGMLHCYLSGLIFTIYLTVVGLTIFQKQEVK